MVSSANIYSAAVDPASAYHHPQFLDIASVQAVPCPRREVVSPQIRRVQGEGLTYFHRPDPEARLPDFRF